MSTLCRWEMPRVRESAGTAQRFNICSCTVFISVSVSVRSGDCRSARKVKDFYLRRDFYLQKYQSVKRFDELLVASADEFEISRAGVFVNQTETSISIPGNLGSGCMKILTSYRPAAWNLFQRPQQFLLYQSFLKFEDEVHRRLRFLCFPV